MKTKIFLIFLFTLFFCVSSVYASIGFQSGQSQPLLFEVTNYAGSSTTGTFTKTPTLGNILIAVVSARNLGSYVSFSETGVTWSAIVQQAYSGVYKVQTEIWMGKVQSGASSTVTVSWTGTLNSNAAFICRICEFSGLDNVSSVDQKTSNYNTVVSATAYTGATSMTGNASELFIAGFTCCSGSLFNTGTSPTNGFSWYYDSSYYGGGTVQAYCYLVASQTTTANCTCYSTGIWYWVADIATFNSGGKTGIIIETGSLYIVFSENSLNQESIKRNGVINENLLFSQNRTEATTRNGLSNLVLSVNSKHSENIQRLSSMVLNVLFSFQSGKSKTLFSSLFLHFLFNGNGSMIGFNLMNFTGIGAEVTNVTVNIGSDLTVLFVILIIIDLLSIFIKIPILGMIIGTISIFIGAISINNGTSNPYLCWFVVIMGIVTLFINFTKLRS